AFLTPASSSAASTFVVTSQEDAPDANPGDGSCAAAAGVCTLRAAVMEANAGPDTDRIELSGATYGLTLPGADEDASEIGDLDVLADLTIAGAAATGTVVRGAWGGQPDRLFEVVAGSLTLSDLSVTGGVVTSAEGDIRQGGGIRVEQDAGLSLQRVVVESNRVEGADGSGGGLFVAGAASIEASVFTENDVAGRGGGLRVIGSATLRNVTLNGNSATDDGGGLAVTGSVTLNNVTVTNNVADRHASVAGDGGGIEVDPGASATVANSILGDNRDPSTEGEQHPDCSGAIASGGNNLIEQMTGCSGSVESDITGVDPARLGFADHGGPTPTDALRANSPAIDNGSRAPAGGGGACEPTDQRGVPRDTCDIGAFERVLCDEVHVVLVGTAGSDLLVGGPGPDGVLAFGGNDVVHTKTGDDAVCGGEGKDRIRGGAGTDRLLGELGKDRLFGQAGGDRLQGGPGRDRLAGGGRRDVCRGGRGKDRSRTCERGRA
ncbi:MAG: choice-of-anchor Q domain-containing protein, partial [Actinomycetota bacterium]